MAESEAEEDDVERALKIVILGDSNTGKTGLAQRFAQHTFPQKYTQTVGVDFYSRRIQLPNNISVLLQIWDVGGHNISSPKMLNTYIFGAHAVLLVYDVTNTQTFENLSDWIQTAKKASRQLEKPFFMALVGNKTDMEHRRVVRIERHNKIAEQHALEPYYVSAKTADSVELMFKTVAAEVLGLRLSKAEQEWNITVVQAQIPSMDPKQPLAQHSRLSSNASPGGNLQNSGQAGPSAANSSFKEAANAVVANAGNETLPGGAGGGGSISPNLTPSSKRIVLNRNSAVCLIQ
ncbi:ras family domain-containing protein [Ditylenchus destructor]|nr:ras family domain-containing protein [Ditylenchus destructor]